MKGAVAGITVAIAIIFFGVLKLFSGSVEGTTYGIASIMLAWFTLYASIKYLLKDYFKFTNKG